MITRGRVRLRSVRREDLPALWALFGDDLELQSLVSDRPPTPRSFERLAGQYEDELRHEPRPAFVVEVGGTVVGRCELHSLDHYSRRCEVGIALGREHRGQGYGNEAVQALVEYAFRHLNMNRVWLQVLAHDARAVAAYRRAGFVEEGRLRRHAWHDGRYRDVLVMAVTRDEPPAG